MKKYLLLLFLFIFLFTLTVNAEELNLTEAVIGSTNLRDKPYVNTISSNGNSNYKIYVGHQGINLPLYPIHLHVCSTAPITVKRTYGYSQCGSSGCIENEPIHVLSSSKACKTSTFNGLNYIIILKSRSYNSIQSDVPVSELYDYINITNLGSYNNTITISRVVFNDTDTEIFISNFQRNNLLENNNKTQEDIKNSINDDSIDKEKSSGFFKGFSEKSFGLTGVITMPLQVIKRLNTNSCSDLDFTIMGKNVSFPSGCLLWNNVPQSTISMYWTVVVGSLSYVLAIDLFRTIERLRNPEDNKGVDTLDL